MQSPSSKLIPKHDSLLFFPFTYVLVDNYFPLSSFGTISKRMQKHLRFPSSSFILSFVYKILLQISIMSWTQEQLAIVTELMEIAGNETGNGMFDYMATHFQPEYEAIMLKGARIMGRRISIIRTKQKELAMIAEAKAAFAAAAAAAAAADEIQVDDGAGHQDDEFAIIKTDLVYAKVLAVANPLAEKPDEIASNISYHAQYSPHFSPFKFELEQAYYAITESVHDRLVQEKDAALGNGGLGRLASCFLDSMATLNLPAWGNLALGKFPNGSRKWIGGEVIQALAYDLEYASVRHSRAKQICLVLYPGDATEGRKLLRLKQQYFLCSASLQERTQGPLNWSEFPTKVAVQLNDTHPTLSIPVSMLLLTWMKKDLEGMKHGRTIAYTNHTVLLEALEKWSQPVMWKLLPRNMEIIEEIDKRFTTLITKTRLDLESELSNIRILDNNPQKPVVRMANLCVVSAHTQQWLLIRIQKPWLEVMSVPNEENLSSQSQDFGLRNSILTKSVSICSLETELGSKFGWLILLEELVIT
ncbi:glycogen phosphorylase [Trifolium repens]|nr:glycogen phosphorylase [Trifolium repens]